MNLPNKLSIFRICLVPVFLIVLYEEIGGAETSRYIATGIFIVGAVTDAVDGYIARKHKLITDFGKFIDPLADKILVVAALVYLVSVHTDPGVGVGMSSGVSSWMVIIIVSRDSVVGGIRMMMASKGKIIAASIWGKLKTNVQIFGIILCLLQYRSDIIIMDFPYYWWIMLAATALTVISGAEIMAKNWKVVSHDA